MRVLPIKNDAREGITWGWQQHPSMASIIEINAPLDVCPVPYDLAFLYRGRF
jgi:hypothetical protein